LESISSSGPVRKHTNGWMTVLAIGLLSLALLACLYVLFGFPAAAQQVDVPAIDTSPKPASSSPSPAATYHRPSSISSPAPTATPAPAAPVSPVRSSDPVSADLGTELNAVRMQLGQSQDNLREAQREQRRIRDVSAIFLAVFAFIAGIIVIQVYRQARAWDEDARRGVEEVEAVSAQLGVLRSSRERTWEALPALLQEVGELPLTHQEEGNAFAPRARAIMDEVDDLAYVGQGRLAFQELSSQREATVYLNGLLLSAVSHLSRSDPFTALSRLDQFFSCLTRFPNTLEKRRIAQAYSYRALAGYQMLESQAKEPSWLRKEERAQLENLSRQAFADLSQAAGLDPEWKHTSFVEALLCSRFYFADGESDYSSRSDLYVRGLRRSVELYKGLIDERSYRGPARRNLIRSLKQIAEQTGEKSDFSDFGYALNALPTDEELLDEALASRQPSSQDRFLWQWLLGDEELFGNVERLNLAEYRAFWIRMLDTKVHLRNWRADLAELLHARPFMRDWSIQLLQSEPPITLSNAIFRRQEASGA
jgi:hypothetical protein